MQTKKNYDSEFCGRLPLHQINLIQPYGYLLVLDRKDLLIVQVSENISEILNRPATEVVGKSFQQFIRADNFSEKFKETKNSKVPLNIEVMNDKGVTSMLAIVHTKEAYILVELEPVKDLHSNQNFVDLYQDLRIVMNKLDTATSSVELADIAVKELKAFTGFDKAMMYQFDEDWNGTTIAEAAEPGMDLYLGLKFPASDIPKQARDLYHKNAYRLIPTREFTPVPLYPVMNPITQGFIDMSDCNVRGVAAVHLEYLKNMKVNASMSVRILHNEKLWGLISFHHREPKYLSYESCTALELISNFISGKLNSILHKETFEFSSDLQNKRARLLDNLYTAGNLNVLLNEKDTNLLELFDATGAVLVFNNQIKKLGKTPENGEIENLVYWLQGKKINHIYAETNLSSKYDEGDQFVELGSGILVIPIDWMKGEYVLVFRPEAEQTITWGGNPDEAIQFEPGKQKYHPRNSFELWKQTLKHYALPWRDLEIDAAASLRNMIHDFRNQHLQN